MIKIIVTTEYETDALKRYIEIIRNQREVDTTIEKTLFEAIDTEYSKHFGEYHPIEKIENKKI